MYLILAGEGEILYGTCRLSGTGVENDNTSPGVGQIKYKVTAAQTLIWVPKWN
jgi:hypothetical protein